MSATPSPRPDAAGDLHRRARDLLSAALELPTGRRLAFVEERCAGDRALCREVLSLLAVEEAVLAALERPLVDLAATAGPVPPDPLLGQRLGPYRIAAEIGCGASGTVYRAERSDGAYRGSVAVKVLHLGFGSGEMARRFHRERRILARLEHPNIARLIDAGTTPDGRPYLVMELVEGQRIDHWCDRRRLTVRRRIELFLPVCAALQQAHQNRIIHRDVKPTNILVDAAGRPKLVDFGIACLEEVDTAWTVTALGRAPMTPGYASPEQVRGEPVTTAADVYSAAVVLYELLTGCRPRLQDPQGEPPRPSVAVQQRSPEGERPGPPEERRTLSRRLRGDLDTVLLAALEPDAARRMASAERLADDLRRHLEGLPVRARPHTVAYRGRKFLRRHPRGVAAGLLLVLLLAGVAVDREVQGRRLLAERDRAERVTEFLIQLFERPAEGGEGDTAALKALLDRGAQRIERELADQPDLRADLRTTLGTGYSRLGLYDRAAPQLERALEEYRALYGPDHPAVGQALLELANLDVGRGLFERAARRTRQALRVQAGHREQDPVRWLGSLHALAAVEMDLGELDQAQRLFERVLAGYRQRWSADHPRVAAVVGNLAALGYYRGDYRGAEVLAREALETSRRRLGEDHPQVTAWRCNLGAILREQGRYAEAGSFLEQAAATWERRNGADHPSSITAQIHHGRLLWHQGETAAARLRLEAALERSRALLGEAHPLAVDARVALVPVLLAQGEEAAATEQAAQAFDDARHRLGPRHRSTLEARGALALALLAGGEVDAAGVLARRTLSLGRVALGADHPELALAHGVLAGTLLSRGRGAGAETEAKRALRLLGHLPGDDWQVAAVRVLLGRCLAAQGRRSEGAALMAAGYRDLIAARGATDGVTRRLGGLLADTAPGVPAEAPRRASVD